MVRDSYADMTLRRTATMKVLRNWRKGVLDSYQVDQTYCYASCLGSHATMTRTAAQLAISQVEVYKFHL